VRRNRDALAVHGHMTVADELARLTPAGPETGAVHDVVEPKLEDPQQVLARDTGLAVRLRVRELELLFEHAVDAARLLLLTQLEQVLAVADPATTVLARRVGAALDRAAHRFALRALQEQLHALAPTQLAHGTCITSH